MGIWVIVDLKCIAANPNAIARDAVMRFRRAFGASVAFALSNFYSPPPPRVNIDYKINKILRHPPAVWISEKRNVVPSSSHAINLPRYLL